MSYGAKLDRDICFDFDQKNRFKLQQALLSIKYHKRDLVMQSNVPVITCSAEAVDTTMSQTQ